MYALGYLPVVRTIGTTSPILDEISLYMLDRVLPAGTALTVNAHEGASPCLTPCAQSA